MKKYLILMFGVGLSIILALCSPKGKSKTIILSLYGVLIGGFITIAILLGSSGL